MQNNREILISIAGTRMTKHWPKTEILWSEFVDRLKHPVRSTETLDEYLSMPKSQQDALKDVGGFVGGTFENDIRKAAYAKGHDLITLDMDNIPAAGTDDILKRVRGLGCAAAVYSTRKHASYAPRLRVIIPTDRTATADEYEPAGRKMASLIGIEFCDRTTFDVSRLMYWPSCCKDSEFVSEAYDSPFCSLDGLLGTYGDWRDISQWPQVPGADAVERRRLAKQEDPTKKQGIIGAFCRTYNVVQAMDAFIPGMYGPSAMSGRYTYTGGSTVGGAIVYDGDMFLYSHHATDPCSGLLVNAFDLVRLHRYGDLDKDAKDGTPVNKLPSFAAMSKAAASDPTVSALIAKERHEKAVAAFAQPGGEIEYETDLAWIEKLTVDGNGNYKKTVNNAILVLQNDPMLKGKIVTDEFANRGLVLGAVPWNMKDEKRMWTDNDDHGFFWYIETYYNIAQQDKLDRALSIVGGQNLINDVKKYLDGLKWDGVHRVDTLLPDYLGADKTPYTAAVMRKSLCAAIARALCPGTKYDYMPIFTGPQGIGKSTFLNILGRDWFSDSLTTFEGKEAAEMIQGVWINEVGELMAMTKQESNAVKQFLSKREDIYRAPYGKRTERYPRKCVFFGTSNESEFLKDVTGNRRFWPVDVGLHRAKKSVWEDLPKEVDQIWAEAKAYWMCGEPLYLTKDIEKLAQEQQDAHKESSGKEGIIADFLGKKIPENWDALDLMQRRQFINGNMHLAEGTVLQEREKVCAMEIWTECFGGDPRYMKRQDSREINGILESMRGWTRNKSVQRYGPHGVQRGFTKV